MSKKKTKKRRTRKIDPFHRREASRYEHPVPSREFILQCLEEMDRPTTFQHLLHLFALTTVEEKEGLQRRLKAMERDGQLMSNRRGSYALVKAMELVRGTVQGHRDGFGFLIPDDSNTDIFLPAREMAAVFTDDVVLVRITNPGERRPEGSIVEVLEHNTHQVVGRYLEEDGIAFVDPDNKTIAQDILIAADHKGGASHGQFVVAEITNQPTRRRQAVGRIVEILGDHLTPGMEVELAIRSHELPFEWSTAALREAKNITAEISEADGQHRENLRHYLFVTIDGENAKDFDDAVYCQPAKTSGWDLYVAIADVSHYVNKGTALDQEAERRGNSVYFPAKVIPMLPETLSNHLCSLKPQTDRLVVVCHMGIDEDGVVQRYRFHEAIIHSHARLTYTEVATLLRGEQSTTTTLIKPLQTLYALYKKLQKQRILRGAIDFETLETKIEFDQKGKIKCIVPLERNDAHRMIEEAMLAANVCAARWLEKTKMPILYRVHEGPDRQKLIALRDFLKTFGLRLAGGEKPTAMDYSKLLIRIKKRPDSHLLQTVLLRSLRQALYSPENVGHFGLSYEGYCHFTSPIRRYPDLLVHRAIKYLLHKKPPKKFPYDKDSVYALGEHCSMTERRADRATRDAGDWLKCDYMLNKVGQVFSGRIVEVTGFGVFIELDEIYVQGLLHITALRNDYYHYEPTLHLLRGKRTGQRYRLGDAIKVLVAKVDLDERTIDFELAHA